MDEKGGNPVRRFIEALPDKEDLALCLRRKAEVVSLKSLSERS